MQFEKPTMLELFDGNCFAGIKKIRISIADDCVTVKHNLGYADGEGKPTIDDPDYAKRLRERIVDLGVREWAERALGPVVLDPPSWRVRVELFGGEMLERSGVNAFPDKWDALMEIITELCPTWHSEDDE